MANRFGEKIKQLRELNHLLQRQVASKMEIDTPMLSKLERGERKARKDQIFLFSEILQTSKEELLTLWLADQVVKVVQDEDLALKAIHLAEIEVKNNSKKRAKHLLNVI